MIFIIILMLAFPVTVFAEEEGLVYTALGDSIATGTGSANGDSYTDMFNEYLVKMHKDKIFNEKVVFNKLAVDGKTSGDLFRDLTNPIDDDYEETVLAVVTADIITISIGGNDILQVVRELPPDTEIGDIPPAELAAIQAQIQDEIAKLNMDFPFIVAAIKAWNSEADIYVNNLYNPFVQDEAFYNLVDPYILQINGGFASGQIMGYEVVDVYTAFKEYRNPKSLVNYDYSLDVKDAYLHPRHKGHKLMTKVLKDLY
jgi:lysophospholipase L1-like esterase